jgi:predicted hydrocarbon binding protein
MMAAHSYQYIIGKQLDFKALKGIADLKPVEGSHIMRAQYGDVTVLLFESGEMRAFVRGGELPQLKEALLPAGVKIMGLLQAIKACGVKFDDQAVFAAGKPMAFDYTTPSGSRPTFDEVVHVDSLRESVYAPYALMPEFQLERNAVQGGENAGRKLAEGVKDKEALNRALIDCLRNWKLGAATVSTRHDVTGQSSYDVQVFRVLESAFAAGIPMVNRAMCHFLRGVIRGAYAAFLELENVEVKETHCWGLGDTYCEFEMRVTPK